jgi:hypothetical protein
MMKHLDRLHRIFPVCLGAFSLVVCGLLLLWDLAPGRFSAHAHDLLGALPLVLIAVAYLVYQAVRHIGREEAFKAVLLALAFLFWAANQYWPDSRYAMLCNDLAIFLFVLDVFFVLVGWPANSPDESFAETYVESLVDKPDWEI